MTRDDIDALFVNTETASTGTDTDTGSDGDDDYDGGIDQYGSNAMDDGDDYDDDDDDVRSGMHGADGDGGGMLSTDRGFNPMMTEGEDLPQWILDAEKAERARGNRLRVGSECRQPSRTTGASGPPSSPVQASLAPPFNVYQQTGGAAGGGRAELII